MQPLSTILPKALDQAKANASNTHSSSAPSKSLTLQEDQEGVKILANLLAQDFDIFPVYGKEPEAADNLFKGFMQELGNYTIDKIQAAFKFHRGYANKLSTPGDIRQIIERGNRPPFEPSIYTNIGKKDYFARSTEEKQYMEDYQKFFITGKF